MLAGIGVLSVKLSPEVSHDDNPSNAIRDEVWELIEDQIETFGQPFMLVGRQAQIHTERDRKLEEARQQRQLRRRFTQHVDKPIDSAKLCNLTCRFRVYPTSVTSITDVG